MAHLLEIEDLNIDIATDQALLQPVLGIDLTVDRGQALAIVGESGSGKSLTALSILGLLPRRASLRARRIEFAGRSLQGLSNREWRAIRGDRISMIFQDPMTALDPCYTIGAQMTEVLLQHRPLSAHDARARVLKLLDTARVPSPEERFSQYPHELSGGLRQRVMIAMSLLCEPDLLIADEPTTALDVTIQARILKLLDDIRRASGVGLIIITHDIGVVACVADVIAVMYRGQIVEHGPAQRILANPLHPYTEGLLRSIPVPGRVARGAPLGFIPGIVPPPVGVPQACAFAPRCPYAMDACRTAPVTLGRVDDTHSVRCLLPTDGSGRDPDVWNRLQLAEAS
ncbi:MAG TPA: ABC transporter ATP-binding protein [Burkholderiaceae bacterium]|nr:ABC transporter ATP-binding protein [Burkholderiaceae bacterium]